MPTISQTPNSSVGSNRLSMKAAKVAKVASRMSADEIADSKYDTAFAASEELFEDEDTERLSELIHGQLPSPDQTVVIVMASSEERIMGMGFYAKDATSVLRSVVCVQHGENGIPAPHKEASKYGDKEEDEEDHEGRAHLWLALLVGGVTVKVSLPMSILDPAMYSTLLTGESAAAVREVAALCGRDEDEPEDRKIGAPAVAAQPFTWKGMRTMLSRKPFSYEALRNILNNGSESDKKARKETSPLPFGCAYASVASAAVTAAAAQDAEDLTMSGAIARSPSVGSTLRLVPGLSLRRAGGATATTSGWMAVIATSPSVVMGASHGVAALVVPLDVASLQLLLRAVTTTALSSLASAELYVTDYRFSDSQHSSAPKGAFLKAQVDMHVAQEKACALTAALLEAAHRPPSHKAQPWGTVARTTCGPPSYSRASAMSYFPSEAYHLKAAQLFPAEDEERLVVAPPRDAWEDVNAVVADKLNHAARMRAMMAESSSKRKREKDGEGARQASKAARIGEDASAKAVASATTTGGAQAAADDFVMFFPA